MLSTEIEIHTHKQIESIPFIEVFSPEARCGSIYLKILVLRMLKPKQEDCGFQASLGYVSRLPQSTRRGTGRRRGRKGGEGGREVC